jgi:hypothetical protein
MPCPCLADWRLITQTISSPAFSIARFRRFGHPRRRRILLWDELQGGLVAGDFDGFHLAIQVLAELSGLHNATEATPTVEGLHQST